MKLLIAIPLKASHPMFNPPDVYATRFVACQATWLHYVPRDGDAIDSPVYYRAFSDADLGLNPQHERVRPMRTKLMAKYAFDHGYDFVFRTDTDAYVWINRLLACGFEKHDYMGWCLDYPKHLELDRGRRTAHGGIGFFLSRKAMRVVIDAEPYPQSDGVYWGDIWTGEVLWKHGIFCHRDTRFLDGSNGHQHHGNIFPEELPLEHPYVSVHPVPAELQYEMQRRFPTMSTLTVAPKEQLWTIEPTWSHYGSKRPDICPCEFCNA